MSLDWSAFTQAVSPAQIQEWRRAAQASGARWAGNGTVRLVLVLVLCIPMILIGGLFGFLTIAAGIAGLATGSSTGAFGGVMAIVMGLLSLAVTALLVWVCRLVVPDERRWERWMRLQEFGRDNGLTFSPSDDNPAYPGMIFQYGSGRAALDHFRPVEGRFFDFGNFRYVISNGKSSTTVTWGFLAMRLDRRLPHMLLDSRANNSWRTGTFSLMFSKDQVLSLEGDFNEYFTLYCPAEYERDALYVFTPDLMALCIDEAAPFDIEIVDDWMFVYSPREFKMDDLHLLARLFRILATVGAKALRGTDRYQDERVAAPFVANVVATPGQRLRRRFPIVVLVVLLVVLVVPLIVGVIAVIAALAAASASVGVGVG
jgi:hypothetical protein